MGIVDSFFHPEKGSDSNLRKCNQCRKRPAIRTIQVASGNVVKVCKTCARAMGAKPPTNKRK